MPKRAHVNVHKVNSNERNIKCIFLIILGVVVATSFISLSYLVQLTGHPGWDGVVSFYRHVRGTQYLEPQYARKENESGYVEEKTLTGHVLSVDEVNSVIKLFVDDNEIYAVGISPDTEVKVNGEEKKIGDIPLFTDLSLKVTELADTEPYDYFAESVTVSTVDPTDVEVRKGELMKMNAISF